MLTIRLARKGKKNHATFRVVVMEHTKAAQGKFVEDLGFYDPHLKENQFQIDTKKAEYWLENGAKTSTTVASYLRKAGLKKGLKIDVINKKTTKPKKKEESEEEKGKPEGEGKKKEDDKPEEKEEVKNEEPKKEEEQPKKEDKPEEKPKEEKKEKKAEEKK